MGWVEFALALLVFLGSHRVPAFPGLKQAVSQAVGPRGYTVLFSLLSLAALWWVIAAAGRAPYVLMWETLPIARWAVNIAMPFVILLTALGAGAVNPFAFEGRATGFRPERPGVAGLTRQPLLWALLIWGAVHAWANGDLAHVILFGSFTLFAALGMRIVETRKRKALGAEPWRSLTRHTGLLPFAALLGGRWRPQGPPPVLRLVLGLAAWAILWHLHAPLIGVSPQP